MFLPSNSVTLKILAMCCAEVQCLQSSVLQLQEEKVHQEQLEQEKESQLTTLREKLLTQTQHLDSFQARVSNISFLYST